MNMLVLDTIHGGNEIAGDFAAAGHHVDAVDVYRHKSDIDVGTALTRTYDLVIAPVHLDPDHALLKLQTAPVISHHEAVRRLLENNVPQMMVEITGSRGKTTTAFALAHTMTGPGILHTSAGTYLYPEKRVLWKKSITPASVLAAAKKAAEIGGWLIAEESLGVTGAGHLAVITSADDYPFAAGKKSASAEKLNSVKRSKRVLLAPPLKPQTPAMVPLGDIIRCSGTICNVQCHAMAGSFQTPLLKLDEYRNPLMLAGAAACLVGIDPSPLSTFRPVEGRLSVSYCGSAMIVDSSNSGTNMLTATRAAQYARTMSGNRHITLVIGKEPADGAVCEGFPDRQVIDAIKAIVPDHVILVGDTLSDDPVLALLKTENIRRAPSLSKARDAACGMTEKGSIVLAVKSWR